MKFNMELFKIFYYVAKNNSITNAARELYISQPAVSQSIRQLEDALGGKLFVRTPRGVELTTEGQAIFEYVERANNLLDVAESKFAELKSLVGGSLRIAASDNISKNFLMPYISLFRRMYPDVRLFMYNGTSARTIAYLKNGRADIGFVNMPIVDDEVEVFPCYQMHDCFVAGARFETLKNSPMTAKQLLGYPLILLEKGTNSRNFVDEYFRQNGLHCEPEIEVGSHDIAVSMARAGLGLACVTGEYIVEELARGELFRLNITAALRPRRLGYCKIKRSPLNFACKKFIQLIEDGRVVGGEQP